MSVARGLNEDMAVAPVLEAIQETGISWNTLIWDFEKAHRIPQTDPQDWGLQACTTNPELVELLKANAADDEKSSSTSAARTA